MELSPFYFFFLGPLSEAHGQDSNAIWSFVLTLHMFYYFSEVLNGGRVGKLSKSPIQIRNGAAKEEWI